MNEKLIERIDKELEEYDDKKELSMGDFQGIALLMEIKKNCLKIEKYERESHGGSHGGSYGYDHDYSERRMRDARGRFKSSYGHDGHDHGYGHSYDHDYDHESSGHIEGKEKMIRELRELMSGCGGTEKEQIRKWIHELEDA